MKNFIIALMVVLLGVTACETSKKKEAGPDPDESACTTNSDCSDGRICQAGTCADDKGMTCSTSSDCSASELCVSGSCVVIECAKDSDCASGETCKDNTCVKESAECSANADCSDGKICDDGECVDDGGDDKNEITKIDAVSSLTIKCLGGDPGKKLAAFTCKSGTCSDPSFVPALPAGIAAAKSEGKIMISGKIEDFSACAEQAENKIETKTTVTICDSILQSECASDEFVLKMSSDAFKIEGALTDGVYGMNYGPVTLTASGGSGQYGAWTVSGLPTGLKSTAVVDHPEQIQIAGTPTVTGKFTVTVSVADTVTAKTASLSLALSVSEDFAVRPCLADLTSKKIVCDATAVFDPAKPIYQGHAVAIIAAGHGDAYTCDLAPIKDTTGAVDLIVDNAVTDHTGLADTDKLACLLKIEDDKYGATSITFTGISLKVKDNIGNSEPEASVVDQLTFAQPPAKVPLQVSVADCAKGSSTTAAETIAPDASGEYVFNDIKIGKEVCYRLKVTTTDGKAPYTWTDERKVFDKGNEEMTGVNNGLYLIGTKNSSVEPAEDGEEWNDVYELKGKIDYNKLPRGATFKEVIDIKVSDSCGNDTAAGPGCHPAGEAKLVFNVKKSGKKVTGIKLELQTGTHAYGGTNSTIKASFCSGVDIGKDKKAKFEDCVISKHELDDTSDDNDLEQDDLNTYNFSVTEEIYKEFVRYFKLVHEGGGEDAGWLLQGLRVTLNNDNVVYVNPCAERWMYTDSEALFGPYDAAVCSVIKTADETNAGTDDAVHVKFKTKIDDMALGSYIRPPEQPYFDKVDLMNGYAYLLTDWYYEGSTKPSTEESLTIVGESVGGWVAVGCLAGWEGCIAGGILGTVQGVWISAVKYLIGDDAWGYNDFEQGDETAYGGYFFNLDPFDRETSPVIEKEGDGDYGGWKPESAAIYIYNPADIEKCKKFHKKPNCWLQEEGEDGTCSGKLSFSVDADPNFTGEQCKKILGVIENSEYSPSIGGIM